MTKGRYSSSSRIFERRGDPWLSKKEQERDFQREPETENPDYDFDRRFHHSQNARGKPKTVAPREEIKVVRRQKHEPVEDFARRGANILHKLHRSNQAVRVEDNSPQRFKPCPGCRKALCVAKERCAFPFGRPK